MPENPELLTAKEALSRGDGQAAVGALNRLLRDQPDHSEGLYLMALCANAAGRTDVAIDCLQRGRAVSPDDPDLAFSLGSLLAPGAPNDALPHLRDAVRLRPDFAPAWTNLGNLLSGRGLLEEAATSYEHALDVDPALIEVETNLGIIRQSQGRHDAALRHHENALRRRPEFQTAQHNRLMSMHYNARLTKDEVLKAHRDWGTAFIASLPRVPRQSTDFANIRDKDRKLRVGYVSPDFRNHPVASFFLPLAEARDRDMVDTWCYADVARPDPTTVEIRALSDHWVDVSTMDDAALAARILADRIDILVDLAGHTARNRLAVFAGRAAPLQMTWLGYPGITGLPTIDYRLTDAVADPPDAVSDARDGSEALVRLPDGFLCYRPPVDIPVEKKPGGPETGGRAVTFGSFNNFAKVNDGVLDCWAAILAACPGSVMVLKARALNDPETRQRCLDAFVGRGIDPDRVWPRGTVPDLADHFAAYNDIDIALDTFPYNGTTTTFDALWMGTPVIALRGDRHAARVGASILTHLGLPSLIAADTDDYIKSAVDLALDLKGDLPRRTVNAAGLRAKMRASPLLDADRFARTIEKTYRDKWHKWVGAIG